MQLPYLSVGALALTANAFLVPGDIKDFSVKEFAHSGVSQQQEVAKTVSLDCSTCPYALKSERNGQHEWTNDVASNLEMEITSDGNSLRFNGVSFYPVQAPGLPPLLEVSQKKRDEEMSTKEGHEGNLGLSYSLEYDEKKFENGNSVVTVLMTVMALDGQMVKVDDVEIKAIKESDGKLTLHSAVPVPSNPESPDAKCSNVLCRVMTKVLTTIKKAKDSAKTAGNRVKCFCVKCFQRLAGHAHTARPHLHKSFESDLDNAIDAHVNKFETSFRNALEAHRHPDGTVKLPSHFKSSPNNRKFHHHGHHHQGVFHRMAHVMWATVKIAFVPVLIGVAFGMAASAVGMLVGQLVVFIWMRYRRTDEQGLYEPLDVDGKDVPPPYEDALAAEAATEKEVEDKA
ncbi:MAG: hypothetical protein Q9164_006037 [Protoblastenia rupestris]